MLVDFLTLHFMYLLSCCAGASSDYEAGEGYGVDGAGLSSEAEAYYACPGDPLC